MKELKKIIEENIKCAESCKKFRDFASLYELQDCLFLYNSLLVKEKKCSTICKNTMDIAKKCNLNVKTEGIGWVISI